MRIKLTFKNKTIGKDLYLVNRSFNPIKIESTTFENIEKALTTTDFAKGYRVHNMVHLSQYPDRIVCTVNIIGK